MTLCFVYQEQTVKIGLRFVLFGLFSYCTRSYRVIYLRIKVCENFLN